MRIHYFQHVRFEDLANIELWTSKKKHSLTKTLVYTDESFPSMNDFDWLVIMGGPMNVYEEAEYPWLIQEKKFISEAVKEGKLVIGICLGAQLIANVLGAAVVKNAHKECGWHRVHLTEKGRESPVFNILPDQFNAFHWHGDSFDLPAGATWIARSEGCANQAFEYDGRVFGLQFHLESSEKSIRRLLAHCGHELVEGKYIQTQETILKWNVHLQEIEKLNFRLLDQIEVNAGIRGR